MANGGCKQTMKLTNLDAFILEKLLIHWTSFERGYNPETPCNFPHHSSVMLIEWHAHLSYDWWRLPSGEAALASPCWQAPSNSSLDWASVGITLGPDSEVSVWVLITQCWGITLGQGSWHLSQPMEESREKAYVKDDRRLGLGHMKI